MSTKGKVFILISLLLVTGPITFATLVLFAIGPFIECNSEAMAKHIEKKYGVVLPKTGCQIRAARTWRIPIRSDDGQTFVVRIDGDPNVVHGFVQAYCEPRKLMIYEHGSLPLPDTRHRGLWVPAWFKEPIVAGQIGIADWEDPKETVSAPAQVYIDTSNPERTTVYLEGSYYAGNRFQRENLSQ